MLTLVTVRRRGEFRIVCQSARHPLTVTDALAGDGEGVAEDEEVACGLPSMKASSCFATGSYFAR
jgi:hypothetical protein